jgi:hypothetical protein
VTKSELAVLLLAVTLARAVVIDSQADDDERSSFDTVQPTNHFDADAQDDRDQQRLGNHKKEREKSRRKKRDDDEPKEWLRWPGLTPVWHLFPLSVLLLRHVLDGVRWRPIQVRRYVAQCILAGRGR